MDPAPCTPINRGAASDCRRAFPIPDEWRLCFVQVSFRYSEPGTEALLCGSCNRWRRTTKSNRRWPSNGILKLVCTTGRVSRVKRNWPGVRAYWLVVAGQATGVIARLREPSTYVTTRAAESNDRTPSPPSIRPFLFSRDISCIWTSSSFSRIIRKKFSKFLYELALRKCVWIRW